MLRCLRLIAEHARCRPDTVTRLDAPHPSHARWHRAQRVPGCHAPALGRVQDAGSVSIDRPGPTAMATRPPPNGPCGPTAAGAARL